MKLNKNIEDLFEEKFQDFEVSPPDASWDYIESRLLEKKKRRYLLPFWLKASGIAATFILGGLFLFNQFSEDKNDANAIVDTQKNPNSQQTIEPKDNKNLIKEKDNLLQQNTQVSENQDAKKSKIANEVNHSSGSNYSNNNDLVSKEVYTTNSKSVKKSSLKKNSSFNPSNSSEEVYKNGENNQLVNNMINNETNKDQIIGKKSNDLVVVNQLKDKNENSKVLDNNQKTDVIVDVNKSSEKNTIVDELKSKSEKTNILDNNNHKKDGVVDVNKSSEKSNMVDELKSKNEKTNVLDNNNHKKDGIVDVNKSSEKSNMVEELKSKNEKINVLDRNNQKTDGIADTNKSSEKDAIDSYKKLDNNSLIKDVVNNKNTEVVENKTSSEKKDLLKEIENQKKDKKETKEEQKSKNDATKWAVNAYASPVFYNSFIKEAIITNEFEINEKGNQNAISYGVGVAYNLTNRLSIKAGVSSINLDYKTENVSYANSINAQAANNDISLRRNENSKNLVLMGKSTLALERQTEVVVDNMTNKAAITQNVNYVEIPVELSYAVLNKKFSVQFKGGFSTLLLTRNDVFLRNNNNEFMNIGEASNLNSTHFTGNVGVGINYEFMKNISFNIDPIARYQINPFTKSSNSNPFLLGVNTGLTYRF